MALTVDGAPRPDLTVKRTLARVEGWRFAELSNGQRVFIPDDPNADPADCPVGFLLDKAKQ